MRMEGEESTGGTAAAAAEAAAAAVATAVAAVGCSSKTEEEIPPEEESPSAGACAAAKSATFSPKVPQRPLRREASSAKSRQSRAACSQSRGKKVSSSVALPTLRFNESEPLSPVFTAELRSSKSSCSLNWLDTSSLQRCQSSGGSRVGRSTSCTAIGLWRMRQSDGRSNTPTSCLSTRWTSRRLEWQSFKPGSSSPVWSKGPRSRDSSGRSHSLFAAASSSAVSPHKSPDKPASAVGEKEVKESDQSFSLRIADAAELAVEAAAAASAAVRALRLRGDSTPSSPRLDECVSLDELLCSLRKECEERDASEEEGHLLQRRSPQGRQRPAPNTAVPRREAAPQHLVQTCQSGKGELTILAEQTPLVSEEAARHLNSRRFPLKQQKRRTIPDSNFPPPVTPRLKVITIGAEGSGKSCLIRQFCERRFAAEKFEDGAGCTRQWDTIGIDFGPCDVRLLNGQPARLHFFDLSGAAEFWGQSPLHAFQEREAKSDSGPMTEMLLGSDVVLCVFDSTSQESFTCALEMLKSTKASSEETVAVLVAAKTDLLAKFQSAGSILARAASAASAIGGSFYACSALSGEGVDRLFLETAGAALEKALDKASLFGKKPCEAQARPLE